MTRAQKRAWLAKLLPVLKTGKQRLALFTIALLLALAPVEFDTPHLHVESQPTTITVTAPSVYSNVNVQVATATWNPSA